MANRRKRRRKKKKKREHSSATAGRRATPWMLLAVFGFVATAVIVWRLSRSDQHPAADPSTASAPGTTTSGDGGVADADDQPSTADELIRQRQELDNTVWALEVAAQKHEEAFVALWDNLRKADDKYAVLEAFPFERLAFGSLRKAREYDGGIRVSELGKPDKTLTPDEFRRRMAAFREQGYRIVQTEWHHSAFQQPARGPARSKVSMQLHVARDDPPHRAVLKGELDVEWSGKQDEQGRPLPAKIAARNMQLMERSAPAVFKAILPETTELQPKQVMPLLLYDLDGDGLSEIILGGWNRVYWNRGGVEFEAETLLQDPVKMFDAAIIADFNGDSRGDLVCVGEDGWLTIYDGDDQGKFTASPRRFGGMRFDYAKSFTAGDIDGDGDLDLWIGQYKQPYLQGSMPTPFYNANDGYPAVLLLNDGSGQFADVTQQAGLAANRHRRTYSSSFVDLDEDGDLDLLTVNDFCGIDIYDNDGQGSFTDVTADLVDQRHSFGMAHTFGDYDLDGKLDFYVIGMSSTTARRLDSMNLGRAEHPDINRMRSAMGYGNRMYLARDDGGRRRYVQPSFNDHVARTGWSWGTTSFDFDNDGDRDIYVVNGHNSGKSARDYCTRYWCHDIYTGTSQTDKEVGKLFVNSLDDLLKGEMSWNGFEHNELLVNDGGQDFLSAAFLLGLAFEFDSRAMASDDLDADGRPDLVVVEYRSHGAGAESFAVHVLLNQLETGNHWIGVRLREEGGGVSPIGAHVTLNYDGTRQIAGIVTGDSFSSQHAHTVHFGIGPATEVESLEVEWPRGGRRVLEHPAIDRYHAMRLSAPE